jgi:hypothetical protein
MGIAPALKVDVMAEYVCTDLEHQLSIFVNPDYIKSTVMCALGSLFKVIALFA